MPIKESLCLGSEPLPGRKEDVGEPPMENAKDPLDRMKRKRCVCMYKYCHNVFRCLHEWVQSGYLLKVMGVLFSVFTGACNTTQTVCVSQLTSWYKVMQGNTEGWMERKQER